MQVWTFIAAEELSVSANPLSPLATWFTNSFVFTVIVIGLIIWLSRWATRNMQLVPSGPQNIFEFVVETLYNTFEGVVGRHMIAKVFPLLATLFIFILAANWIGLFPGVGTIGLCKPGAGFLSLSEVDTPLLRPARADQNLTLGMAFLFMGLSLIRSILEASGVRRLHEQ